MAEKQFDIQNIMKNEAVFDNRKGGK